MAVLSIGTLFDEINAGAIDVGLHVSLLDKRIDASDQILRVWLSKLADADQGPATPLQYEHAFEFADRQWTVRVEASPAWVRAHASRSAPLVPLGGALLTLFLLIYLQQTLVRRARAEALVASQSSDLVERERAYETLVEHLPDVVCRFDRHSRYVFANAAFERSLGLSHEAIRGKTVREAFSDYPGINPALIDCWEHVLRRLHETGEAERIEFGFPGDDGPRFFDGILVIEAATETTGETVLVILHEVTARQLAEAWARKLSLAVEQSPATIIITDTEGCIEYVNDKFVETTGYTKAQAIGNNPRMLSSGKTDPRLYEALWTTVKAGRSWRGEIENRRRDGSLFWERVLIAPLQDASGKVTNYVEIKEDISALREANDRLLDSDARFRGVVAVMAEGLTVMSPEGVLIFVNHAAEAIFALNAEGLQGKKPEQLELERIHENGCRFAQDDWPTTTVTRSGCEVRDVVMGLRFPDGTVRWILINASPLGAADHQGRYAVVSTFRDITARCRADEQLQLAFEAISHSGEGIMVTDAEQRIISVNPAFELVTGYSAAEVLGQTPQLFSSGRHDGKFYRAMWQSLEVFGYWQGEIWNRRKNGEIYPEWLGISVVRQADGSPKHFIAIFSDITERKAAQQRIEFLAHHDPLTLLPNRLLLRDRVDQAIALAGRQHSGVALLFLDLDRFKTINDSLGHPVGDALLKAVVERLKACVRDSDTISRQGGDEFVIVLNEVRDSESVSRLAEKIQRRMVDPFILENHALSSSFSIGIALFPDDGGDFDTLTRKADTAMYHAKQAGRNTHRFFTEQMNVDAIEHLHLETQLRLALERQEFVLHYQPQIDLRDGRIVGVEALVRWLSPEHGLVSPNRFIPIAEESGLIVGIGSWVLGEACRQARRWQDAGLPPLVVAVNLSAMQFRKQDLVTSVINALVLADLDSQWLELELTESILIQDAEATLDTVRRLKALGIKLSVDDFGTGYSSLAYLKRFAVDKLKIDQSFVRDLVSDPDDAAIVRAIVQMAHGLKLRTIAEGVETVEQADHLRMFHCDEVQGYLYARPMPADDFATFFRQRLAAAGESLTEPDGTNPLP